MGLLKSKRSIKHVAFKSNLFKIIRSDARNTSELRRMIANTGISSKIDENYSFFIDGEKKIFKALSIPVLN